MDATVQARLLERQEDRKTALEKRRTEREQAQRVEESADFFEHQFTEKKRAVTDLFDGSGDVPREKLSAYFDELALKCHDLQKYVSDSVHFLTAYSLGQYQQQVLQLQYQISVRREELMPKKKFVFKSRKKESSNPTPKTKDVTSSKAVTALSEQSKVGFKNKSHESLSMSESEINGQDVNLSRLSHCEIQLPGTPSTLHMSELNNCRVLCGPVSSSVFVEGCKECVFVVACQQLRIHTTTLSAFYVHITSRSIIEDSSTVTFTPYSWSYPQLEEHFKVSGLDQSTNNWQLVDDFNWLASTEPSPNWTILPEKDRIDFT